MMATISPFAWRARLPRSFSRWYSLSSDSENTAPTIRRYVGSSRPSYAVAKASPKERNRVRLPIIINGAGPAGLMLAIGLRNVNIPFEVCERHDRLSRPRRNYISILSHEVVNLLMKVLNYPTTQSLIRGLLAAPHPLHPPPNGRWVFTESLMERLRDQISVNYGFQLESKNISCVDNVLMSKYITGSTSRTFLGSLMVGADGITSAGRFSQRIRFFD